MKTGSTFTHAVPSAEAAPAPSDTRCFGCGGVAAGAQGAWVYDATNGTKRWLCSYCCRWCTRLGPANIDAWKAQPFAVGDQVLEFYGGRVLEGVVVEVRKEYRFIGEIVVRWGDIPGTCIECAERLLLVLPQRRRHP